jgi:hypothetical protein
VRRRQLADDLTAGGRDVSLGQAEPDAQLG